MFNSKEIYQLFSEIEAEEYYESSFEIADKFKEILKKYGEELGGDNIRKRIQWEINLFNLSTHPDKTRRRFKPVMVFNGKGYPEPESLATEQGVLDYFKERCKGVRNPFMKVRYADFLWEYLSSGKEKKEFGVSAVKEYHRCADKFLQKCDYDSFNDAAMRIIEFTKFGVLTENQAQEEVEWLISHLQMSSEHDNFEVLYITANALLSANNRYMIDRRAVIEKRLGVAEKHFWEGGEFSDSRRFLELKLKWFKKFKAPQPELEKIRIKIAESFINEAKARETEGNFLAAAVQYEEGIKSYLDLGKPDLAKPIKVGLKDCILKAEGKFKTISVRGELPSGEINKWIRFIKGDSTLESLKKLALDETFMPDLEKERRFAEQSAKKYPLSTLIPRLVIDQGKIITRTTSEEEAIQLQITKNIVLKLQLVSIFLEKLFDTLINEQGLNVDSLIAHFKAWGLIEEESLLLLKKGFERYFEGDYVSTLYILLPQFERILQNVFREAGMDTTTVKDGRYQDTTLGGFLEKDFVKDTLEPGLYKLFQVLMIAQDGLNLRNDMAHGYLEVDQCTKGLAVLVIYSLLLLTRLRVEDN